VQQSVLFYTVSTTFTAPPPVRTRLWWWSSLPALLDDDLKDHCVQRGTNEKDIVQCTRDQRKRDLAPTQNHPHPNCTTSRGPSDLRARTVHLCSVAGGPCMFAESGNSSGDYAGRCKTTPSWCGGGGIEYGHFSPCSTEEHTQQKAACNKELFLTSPPRLPTTTITIAARRPPRARAKWWRCWWW